jgi:FtsZ-interacting cell division protein ZipA
LKFSRLKFHEEQTAEEPEVEVEESKELWPLENTEKYDKYIRKQKDRHEVLVTRNILKKIKKNITGKDTLQIFSEVLPLIFGPHELFHLNH